MGNYQSSDQSPLPCRHHLQERIALDSEVSYEVHSSLSHRSAGYLHLPPLAPHRPVAGEVATERSVDLLMLAHILWYTAGALTMLAAVIIEIVRVCVYDPFFDDPIDHTRNW